MGVIKHRPSIGCRVARDVRAGSELDVEIVLDAKAPVPVEWIRVTLLGRERTVYGSGKNSASYSQRRVGLVAELSSKAELPKGQTSYSARFPLDKELPPTTFEHSVRSSRVDYSLSVQASIPWWPDARATFAIHVLPPPLIEPRDHPLRIATRRDGPRGGEPYIEVALDSRSYRPGDAIRGRVALFNVASNAYKSIEIALTALVERRRAPGRQVSTGTGPSWTLRLPVAEPLREGEAQSFALRVPPHLTPTYSGSITGRKWMLEVTARTRLFRSDAVIRIPVYLEAPPLHGSATERARTEPPSVGSELLSEVWTQVAGEVPELELDESQNALRGKVDRATLTIYRTTRSGEGAMLMAEVRFPSVHLDLDGGLASGFRRVVGGGVELGDETWDRKHYIAGRDQEQVAAFCRALGPTLLTLDVQDLADGQMIVQRADPGLRHESISELAKQTIALAKRIESARAEIPAPTTMKPFVEEWRRLAKRLHGELELARMAIRGQWQGDQVKVVTEWGANGRVWRTSIALSIGSRIDEDKRIRWSKGDEAPAMASWSKQAQQLFIEAKGRADALIVGDRSITLGLDGPLQEPMSVPSQLELLSRLAGALLGAGGPYR